MFVGNQISAAAFGETDLGNWAVAYTVPVTGFQELDMFLNLVMGHAIWPPAMLHVVVRIDKSRSTVFVCWSTLLWVCNINSASMRRRVLATLPKSQFKKCLGTHCFGRV